VAAIDLELVLDYGISHSRPGQRVRAYLGYLSHILAVVVDLLNVVIELIIDAPESKHQFVLKLDQELVFLFYVLIAEDFNGTFVEQFVQFHFVLFGVIVFVTK